MNAANDQVIVTSDGKKRRVSKSQAAAMQLATKAAGGDQRAIAHFLTWIDEIESREAANRPAQFPLSASDLEVLQAVYERMKQCELSTQ
jgi:adenylosuccinate synthase